MELCWGGAVGVQDGAVLGGDCSGSRWAVLGGGGGL